uniref:Uncharacterized protein n=1 Tax=Aegilops tauschii subsp. strangulata TaxID=200361 RepID=A0A453D946_AEGTS
GTASLPVPSSHPAPPHLRSSRSPLQLPTAKSGARDGRGGGRGTRARRMRPVHQVAAPFQPPVPVLPEIDASSPEAQAEMPRVVRERFPNRSRWPDILLEILRFATFEERARFAGDDGGMDYEFIFWAIQEAESTEPRQAARWVRFKTRAQHTSPTGGADHQHPAGIPAAGDRPSEGPLKHQHPGARALQGDPDLQARRRRNKVGCNLEPPPWPGDRGEKPHLPDKGRKWKSVKCILAKVSCYLHHWKVLCDDVQATLLQRCILLLDKRRGELLRIAWR